MTNRKAMKQKILQLSFLAQTTDVNYRGTGNGLMKRVMPLRLNIRVNIVSPNLWMISSLRNLFRLVTW